MNKIKAIVKKVLSDPYYEEEGEYSWWSVDVKVIDISMQEKRKSLMFETKQEVEQVKVGYEFLH